MKRSAALGGVLGLFGGTFDPVHIGHLRTAWELRAYLGIDRTHFIPAAVPPHRPQPAASAQLRVAMLEAALADDDAAVVDRRELERAGPSYSIDTAESFRAEFPDHALCLLLGMDAFLGLIEWRDWERLLTARRVTNPATDRWEAAGQIVIHDVTQLEIAATDLRRSIRAGVAPKYLIPDPVWNIIVTSGCYAGA